MECRSTTSVSVLGGALALLSASCAFEPGEPIGRLAPSLTVVLDLGDGRVADGRWLTSNDYAIALTAIDVTLTSFAVGLSSGESPSSVDFDPNDPPPGYGLCHGGHCHADDGRLVAYEDIEAELARGGLDAERVVTLPALGVAALSELSADPIAVELGACPERCAVPASRLVSATVGLDQVRIVAKIFDRRVGAGARLPAEGLSFAMDVDVEASVSAPIAGSFGHDEPPVAAVAATLRLDGDLFDGVDFAALSVAEGAEVSTAAAREMLASALASSLLTVVVTQP